MQTASYRIWNHAVVSISYDNNTNILESTRIDQNNQWTPSHLYYKNILHKE